jgi:hypothetical protein
VGAGSDDSGGIAVDLTVPVHNRFALRFSGHSASGNDHPIRGFAAGGRLLFH